ncbi:MAG: sugar ABC transporter permease [Chloroflexi bacterium]|nr:sugar ABC transporter permease [Chloroflexota bacterium]
MSATDAAANAARVPVAGRTSSGVRLRQSLAGWFFSLPFVLIFAVFLAIPLITSFLLSFTSFGLRDLRNPVGASFIGLENYAELLGDPTFHTALINTAVYVVAGVPLTLIAGLAVAVALNGAVRRFRTLFRVGYYLPVVTSIVAIAVVWRFVLSPDQGLANLLLRAVGLPGQNWLGNPALAMPAIIAMIVWKNLGFSMVIFLAGLQTIPTSLYEAARIDGAGKWQEFRYVTLPGLRPTMLFSVVTTTIGYLQIFEEPFVMTGGGPLDRTMSLSMYIYEEGFSFFHQGYAAAIAYVLFAIVAVVAVVQFRILRSET